MAPYAQHAEDLLRAISELDLTALRARANSEADKTPFENGPTYSTEELFKMRAQERPEAEDEQAEVGLKSPELPVAPPSTPAHPSPGPTASKPEGGEPNFTPLEEIAEEDALEMRAPLENGPKYSPEELVKLKPAQVPDTRAHDGNGLTHEQTKEELGEPPEEIRIRRQVEYYFSDDNLPDDVFLWKRTEGSSQPIAVEKIASFGRMRQFEYSAVVAALKESKFLDITGSEGHEMVKRKKLYDPANPISHADTYTDYDKYPDAPKPADIPQPGEKSKKKRSKKGGLGPVAPKVKQPKPTGFEDYYADPPMTPEEAIDAYEDSYHPELPFHERMQNCIQRYRGRRKLDEKKSHIFTQYLTLGGINSGAKQFTGGLDEATLENCTADEIRAIRATDLVGGGGKNSKLYDPEDAENWVIDFEGVAKGFFSYRVPTNLHYETEADIKLCSTVIKNFLNYVLAQGACPEYTDDIMAARRVCDRAEKELWEIEQLSKLLPGSYNIAASTLYGGQYKGQYFSTENNTWDLDDETEKPAPYEYGMIDAKADRIFKTAVAFHNKEAAILLLKNEAKLTKVENRCFEVVEIERPKIDMIDLVARIKDHHNQTGNIKPLGLLKVKHWDGPGFVEEDCSDDESTKPLVSPDAIETFWFEDEILKHCFVGMKLEAVVRALDVGVKYCDVIPGTYCSFFTYLENEKMKDWKEPVPNERPPPTEDNPDAEAVTEAELKDFD